MNARMLLIFFVAAIFLQQNVVYGFNGNIIVNGTPTPDGMFEFLPRLTIMFEGYGLNKIENEICSSTIINILTAAHCVLIPFSIFRSEAILAQYRPKEKVVEVPGAFQAKKFQLNLNNYSLQTKIYFHPSWYSTQQFEYDMAIIEFPDGTNLGITPVKFATKTQELVNLTVAGKLRSQLNVLLGKLCSTGTHFVRCIKPNSEISPSKFEDVQILSLVLIILLKSAGIYFFRSMHSKSKFSSSSAPEKIHGNSANNLPKLPADYDQELETRNFQVKGRKQLNDTFGELAIKGYDLYTLRTNQYVNDAIIDIYLKMVAKRSIENPPHYRKTYSFGTFFYTMLNNGQDFDKLVSWVKDDLFDFELLFLPINQENHWFLFVVDMVYAEHLSRNAKLDFCQSGMTNYRKIMLYELMRGELIPKFADSTVTKQEGDKIESALI